MVDWQIIRRIRSNHLAISTLAMTAGLGLRTAGQGLMFLIVARVLGVNDYGAYSAIVAIAGSLSCFAGLGTAFTLIREVARSKEQFGHAWHKALVTIGLTAPPLLLLHLALARLILPASISWTSIFFIGIAELIFAPLSQAAANVYQGHDRIVRSSRLVLAPVIPRLLGSLFFAAIAHGFPTALRLDIWSILYAVASFFAAIYSLYVVRRDFGPGKSFMTSKLPHELWDGIAFAFGGAAIRLYSDVDKTMLAKMATLEVTGAYSAAYRVVDMALVPITSLLTASLPSFFRAREAGPDHSLALTGRLIRLPILYALLAATGMYLFASIIPLLLGNTFATAIAPLRWLALMPVICLPRLFLQQLLIGNDHQAYAVASLTFGALLNIGINLLLIPSLGWLGAVTATYIAEAVMCLIMAYMSWRTLRSKPISSRS
jgi:O-antigen/teichoic acid export membrane protein